MIAGQISRKRRVDGSCIWKVWLRIIEVTDGGYMFRYPEHYRPTPPRTSTARTRRPALGARVAIRPLRAQNKISASDRVRGRLRRDPFDAEDALRRVLIANCDGVLIGRGVIQRLQFVQILELNHDNTGRGCRAFVGDRLTAAHNKFAARVGNRFGYEGEIFLIVPVLILDCDLNDVVGWWLGLSMEGLNHSSAERSARDHRQPDGGMPTNHVSP